MAYEFGVKGTEVEKCGVFVFRNLRVGSTGCAPCRACRAPPRLETGALATQLGENQEKHKVGGCSTVPTAGKIENTRAFHPICPTCFSVTSPLFSSFCSTRSSNTPQQTSSRKSVGTYGSHQTARNSAHLRRVQQRLRQQVSRCPSAAIFFSRAWVDGSAARA